MFLKWRGFGSRRCAIPGSQIEVHVVTKFSVVLGGNIHTRFSSSLVFDMFLSYFVTIPTSKVKGIENSRCLATLEYVKPGAGLLSSCGGGVKSRQQPCLGRWGGIFGGGGVCRMVGGRGPGGAGGEAECFQCQGTYERTKNTNDHETKGPMYHITRSRDCCNAQQINHKGIRSFISRNSEQTVKADIAL